MKTTAVILLLCIAVGAQDQPRHFWGRRNVALTVAHVALAGADAGRTCSNLSHGGHERFLPSQSCAGVSTFIFSGVALNIASRWLLERRSHTTMSTVAGVAGSVNSANGFIYSSTH